MMPSGLLPGAICLIPASGPGLTDPVAVQLLVLNGPGKQSPNAANLSFARWMLASARASSGGPTSVL